VGKRNRIFTLAEFSVDRYDPVMSLGPNIQAWRVSQGYSIAVIAKKSGLSEASLEAIESGATDPSLSTLQSVAAALGIPASWLHVDPKHLELLTDPDEEGSQEHQQRSVDPVVERVLLATRQELGLYVLLTTILQSGDPKLLRAAEASLRSLAKQAKQPTVPWQSRPPGHFEPPSD
jgi:transcriptional regulator with XRE-family HTH domain